MPTPGGQGRSTSREQSANDNSQEDGVEVTDSGQNNTQEEQEPQEYNSSSEEESECDYSMRFTLTQFSAHFYNPFVGFR